MPTICELSLRCRCRSADPSRCWRRSARPPLTRGRAEGAPMATSFCSHGLVHAPSSPGWAHGHRSRRRARDQVAGRGWHSVPCSRHQRWTGSACPDVFECVTASARSFRPRAPTTRRTVSGKRLVETLAREAGIGCDQRHALRASDVAERLGDEGGIAVGLVHARFQVRGHLLWRAQMLSDIIG